MESATESAQGSATLISFTTSQGVELRATPLKLTRFKVAFEAFGPSFVLRTSEVLQDFKIRAQERLIYSGRAVIVGLVNAGTIVVCEATLQDCWLDSDAPSLTLQPQGLQVEFNRFLSDWEKTYKIRPEYKLVTVDLQSFMMDLRLWLEQVELGVRSLPTGDRVQAERAAVQALALSITPALSFFFEKFERMAREVDPESGPAHSAFCRRQLHPLLLSSPFMHRIYFKPLGYAGDYEMVNMILRDPCEGGSLFAKLLNVFILNQTPAVAHRNRVSYLTNMLVKETVRGVHRGRRTRILNLGCGPAREVQNFIDAQELSNHAEFELLDFEEQTLLHVRQKLEELKRSRDRQTAITMVRKSVLQVLKQAGKPKANGLDYDVIYCAGLFDYLNDRTCKSLLALFYDLLAPGGLLVATNVEAQNPIRKIMEHIFEWHLVYRSGSELAALAPALAPAEAISFEAEESSGNVFLEVRKPLMNT